MSSIHGIEFLQEIFTIVHELENVVERALILVRKGPLKFDKPGPIRQHNDEEILQDRDDIQSETFARC